ncbi:SURF1 family protein [Ilumatobacter sp.]|uniref:SURF1 family protein n=1 Tax=Ilumatobacter sp. TaxID=1967498 RepID=UPI003B528061
MARFLLRPRWLGFHALVLAAIVVMANLGFWQLDRLDERREFNAVVAARSERDPVPVGEVLDRLADGELDPESAEWIPVTVTGTYSADQVIEFNNSQGGRAGDDVLSALVTDGPTVVVNRGFVPLGFDLPAAPSGSVEVLGWIRPSEERDRGSLTDADDGSTITEVRRIDLDLLARRFPGEVAPVYVQLIASSPPVGPGDPDPVTPPDLGEGPHLGYALQWFTFAVAVAVGWVLAVRRSLAQRRTPAHPDDAGRASHGDARRDRGRRDPDRAPADGAADPIRVAPGAGTAADRD